MVNHEGLFISNLSNTVFTLISAATLISNFSRHMCGAYQRAALIWGQRLFKNCTRQIYFFYIFIQLYTFYLLIFLWTDTKLMVNLELPEKLTRWKIPKSFMIMRAKLSAVRANSFIVVEQFTTFSQFRCHCLRIGGAVLIRGRRLLTLLSQMRRFFEGGAYSSKYGNSISLKSYRTFSK